MTTSKGFQLEMDTNEIASLIRSIALPDRDEVVKRAAHSAMVILSGIDSATLPEAQAQRAANKLKRDALAPLCEPLAKAEEKLRRIDSRSEEFLWLSVSKAVVGSLTKRLDVHPGTTGEEQDKLLREWAREFWPLLSGKPFGKTKACRKFFAIIFGDARAESQNQIAYDEGRNTVSNKRCA